MDMVTAVSINTPKMNIFPEPSLCTCFFPLITLHESVKTQTKLVHGMLFSVKNLDIHWNIDALSNLITSIDIRWAITTLFWVVE